MTREANVAYATTKVSESSQVVEVLKCSAAAIPLSALAVETHCNGEADAFPGTWPTRFSKGLEHNAFGIVTTYSYNNFFEEISDPSYTDNMGNRIALFDSPAYCGSFQTRPNAEGSEFSWRNWDMPLAYHQLVAQAPEANSVALAPAPCLGSDELAAEMAELYAMAYLRDLSFEAMRTSKTSQRVAAALSNMPWFDPEQTPTDAEGNPLSMVSSNRRTRDGENLTPQTLFRGSSAGCADGPYVSQFLLQGAAAPEDKGYAPRDERAQSKIGRWDQRITERAPGVDYLRDWAEWLDVQNGANTKKELAAFEGTKKYIETPRDLATLACSDASCKPYLNTAALLFDWNTKSDLGMPKIEDKRHFDGSEEAHLLSLLKETAKRAHRASWQQKFETHNRARPEKLGSVACLIENGYGAELGAAEAMATQHVDKLGSASTEDFNLIEAIVAAPSERRFKHNTRSWSRLPEMTRNLLLPMASPGGSPMHPSYGAGHATIAGGCVTVLKAFFRTHDADQRPMSLKEAGAPAAFVPEDGGLNLKETKGDDAPDVLTLNGELNKLAENMSLAGCMAGVNYYSDSFDSLRMGERIAVGILAEHMATFRSNVTMTLETFDGDILTISGNGAGSSEIRVSGCSLSDWWTRHLPPQPQS
ncbi:hypothetical protein [Shimia sp.]|uniref:hypothetical protein n=1 Tax=Shimia sp. TaxID=1954381 RepID=UPI003BAB1906